MKPIKPIYRLLKWIPIDKLDWRELSMNPRAERFIQENKNKFNDKMEENINKIEWVIMNEWIILPETPKIREPIPLLKENIDIIDWKNISRDPNIFELDYVEMSKERTEIFFQELMIKTWIGSRLCQCININGEMDTMDTI